MKQSHLFYLIRKAKVRILKLKICQALNPLSDFPVPTSNVQAHHNPRFINLRCWWLGSSITSVFRHAFLNRLQFGSRSCFRFDRSMGFDSL